MHLLPPALPILTNKVDNRTKFFLRYSLWCKWPGQLRQPCTTSEDKLHRRIWHFFFFLGWGEQITFSTFLLYWDKRCIDGCWRNLQILLSCSSEVEFVEVIIQYGFTSTGRTYINEMTNSVTETAYLEIVSPIYSLHIRQQLM